MKIWKKSWVMMITSFDELLTIMIHNYAKLAVLILDLIMKSTMFNLRGK